MNKHAITFIILILLVLFFFYSCNGKKENIASYSVVKKDFQNTIAVDGVTEPVQSINIVCPNAGGGGNIARLIDEGVWVKEGDTICIIENTYMKEWYDNNLANLESKTASFEKSKADLKLQYALLEAQVKNNEAQTQIAHLDSLQLQYYTPKQRYIKELELKKVAIERKKLTKKLESLNLIQQSEMKKLELEIQRTTFQVKSTEKMMEELVLLAPKDGLTIRAISPITGRKFEVGDNVYGSMPLVILPVMDKMKLNIMASETDYRYINVGDSVTYTFDAMRENEAWGKIINKMPVGKEMKQGSKIKFFEVSASIDSVKTMPDPGFTASCRIFLKEIPDTIVIPQISVFNKDSIRVVYVEHKNGYEMRQVEVAESSAKEAIISKGLEVGEKVALREPSVSKIMFTKLLSDTIQ